MLTSCYDKKFLITGRSRTGTTILTGICNSHPELEKCHYEPLVFTPRLRKDLISGERTLKSAVHQYYQTGDGIKELLGIWEVCDNFVHHIFTLPVKVILMERKNLVRQAVSLVMASKLKLWQTSQTKDRESYIEAVESLGNLDLDRINKNIQKTLRINAEIENKIGKPFMKIVYEDFFLGDQHFQEETVLKVFEWIGVEPIYTPKIKSLLAQGRLNDEEVYSHIKNVKEIDDRFRKFGHLLVE